MRGRSRKILVCTLFSLLLVSTAFLQGTQVAYGATVQEKINNATKSKKEALAKANDAKQKKKTELAEKETLDHEIDVLESELSTIDSIISEADYNIAQKETQIKEFELKIAENEDEFRKRLRAMDESNVGTYIDILLGSENFSDFLARVQTIAEIAEFDQGVINNMIALKNGVVQSKQEIEASKAEQVEARSLVSSKKSQLDAKLREKESFIQSLNSDITKFEKAYKEAEQQEEALKRSLQSSLSSSSSGPKFSGEKFLWPTTSYTITSPYGYRKHPVLGTNKFHSGIDISATTGTPIYAANAGTVKLAAYNGGYGNCVVLDHGGGYATLYGHSSVLLVSAGEKVTKGQVIAKAGSTGVSTGPHLHFEVLVNGSTTNPMSYFK